MIPIRLKIDGFLSYFEPVELQFDSFELACISGSNGAGKSSILDAITWVLFGQARRKDDAIINNRADSAEVVLDFAYEGAVYRVQRIKKKEKSTQLEFYIQTEDHEWKALTEHGIIETEKRITETLRMDYETFINASFFLQGKADQFAQQKPADRKRILSNILGLERWEQYRESAANRRKGMEQQQAVHDGSIQEIDRELAEEDQRKKDLKQKEESLGQVSTLLNEKRKSLETLRSLAAMLDGQKHTVKVLLDQFESSQKRLRETREKIQQLTTEKDGFEQILKEAEKIEKGYSEWQTLTKKLSDWGKLAMDFHMLDGERNKFTLEIASERSSLATELKNFQGREKQINALKTALPKQEQLLETLKSGINLLENELKQKEQNEQDEQKCLQEITAHETLILQLNTEMTKLSEKIASIESTTGATCPLCGQSLTEEHRTKILADLNEELGQKTQHKATTQKEISNLRHKQETLKTERERLQNLEKDRQLKQNQLVQQETLVAANKDQLSQWAEKEESRFAQVNQLLKDNSFAEEARAKQSELDAKIKLFGYDLKQHEAIRKDVQNLLGSEVQMRNLEKALAALEPLRRELGGLESQEAGLILETEQHKNEYEKARDQYERSAASLPDLKVEEKALVELTNQENALRAATGAARQKVDVLKDLKAHRQELEEQIDELRQQIATIRTLERAFGKDGIPALLIEQSLPEIEMRANEILDRLSSGSMSVRFETQKDLKTREEKKETLDILISDSAGQRAYEMYSGGEAFRVNFAIRLALSHLLAQRAGARLQTLVIDEGFGSQDADGRQRLIEAINMVKPDYAKILVITHLEELKDVFPARIEVEKTSMGSQVRVIAA
jgi:exonuclease SbcC